MSAIRPTTAATRSSQAHQGTSPLDPWDAGAVATAVGEAAALGGGPVAVAVTVVVWAPVDVVEAAVVVEDVVLVVVVEVVVPVVDVVADVLVDVVAGADAVVVAVAVALVGSVDAGVDVVPPGVSGVAFAPPVREPAGDRVRLAVGGATEPVTVGRVEPPDPAWEQPATARQAPASSTTTIAGVRAARREVPCFPALRRLIGPPPGGHSLDRARLTPAHLLGMNPIASRRRAAASPVGPSRHGVGPPRR
ncbi:MAG TPA: hypothetical protein VMT69_13455 [Kineosporiaceae bacterium]|nr:hypothetical protein [Kineosporiaceae bacterium]